MKTILLLDLFVAGDCSDDSRGIEGGKQEKRGNRSKSGES